MLICLSSTVKLFIKRLEGYNKKIYIYAVHAESLIAMILYDCKAEEVSSRENFS